MAKAVALIAGISGIGLFAFLYPVWILSLAENDRVIFGSRVKPGDTFQLAYLHSIALSDVRDFFSIDADYRIVLTETRFQGQGTGLPYGPNRGEKLSREGDWFRITGMQRVVPAIAWRVQSQWRNRFRFGDLSEKDLSAGIGDAMIHIQVQKMSLASYLRIRSHTGNL
jgi:hypothetical protein